LLSPPSLISYDHYKDELQIQCRTTGFGTPAIDLLVGDEYKAEIEM